MPISMNSDEHMKLATIYVVFQEAGELFTPEKALEEGTIFPELVQPYKKRDMEVSSDG